jgi:hypothetical protein
MEKEYYMLKKSFLYGLFLYIFAISPLHAAMVSFLVIETGLPEGSPISQYTTLWENSLLEVFFESGHIVTNSPILRLAEKPSEDLPYEAERDLDNAKDGGMHFFLLAIVDHNSSNNVSLRLFKTSNHELLQRQEHSYTGSKSRREEQDSIKKTIGVIAAQLH